MLRHLDLFSGIGGFALATEMIWDDVEHIFCEIEPFCQKVLNKHWPNAKIYEDIKKLRGEEIGTVDLLTGGFPCQPFSIAGKQRGKDDDRDLWPEMFRIIKECKPTWIIGENVAGFIEMELERSVSDLEGAGYEVQAFVIPACAVKAPHRRDRVWIVGYSEHNGQLATKKIRVVETPNGNFSEGSDEVSKSTRPARVWKGMATDTLDERREMGIGKTIQGKPRESREPAGGYQGWSDGWPVSKPRTVGVDDGIPNRTHRIKGLGNAIVPQVAAEIMHAIKSV